MYGIWKRRFPVLSMGLRVRIQNALTIIIATAVLHNIAIQTNDIIPPADYTLHEYFAERIQRNPRINDNVPVLNIYDDPPTAIAFRNAVIAHHFV